MNRESQGMLSPTPRYYEIRGRAAEIARASYSLADTPEYFFLAMIHGGGWPLSAISRLVDLVRAEATVRDIMGSPAYSAPASSPPLAGDDYTQPLWGAQVAVDMGDSHLGLEHALLAMIRSRETVPARALGSLADLDELDTAVTTAANAPVLPHQDAAFLPENQTLDGALLGAIDSALPEGATFGFNSADGRTWIHVYRPDRSLGRSVSRDVLNSALVSLGRPGLGR